MRDEPLNTGTMPGILAEPQTEPCKKTDKRKSERFECDGVAEISLPHAGLRISGRIADLSISGCFIEASSINLERGTQVEVMFHANRLSFRIGGNIAVLRPRVGVGIAFLHPSDRILRQIRELVAELKARG